ncbi:uncharacterized protein TNCV_4007081 [Trichonephila clavipes]|nr:uncharacterized protein TNCV_4007081 [Trichonephila clavipes]
MGISLQIDHLIETSAHAPQLPMVTYTGVGSVPHGLLPRYNMLTKYQMIKFIDFCEVWFLPESVARVAAIVGDHRCHTPRHRFKETLDVFLGYSRPSSFHALLKLIWCGS